MTTPPQKTAVTGQSSPMTPERWREVDAVLRGALACEPARRDAFVAHACGDDQALRREVASLLAAHDRADDDFLERPAADVLGSAPSPLVARLVNALADRYEIERELAHGGMATVYLARDLRHGRPVAIKVLREEIAAAVGAERFLEEIRVTASLQHPNILPLFDSGSVGYAPEAGSELLWYVMPFVEGETLRSRLTREGRLPVDSALQLAREMADALEYAHRHGVVHRDVKPENVLLQSGHALVADFGIALALERAGGERLTRTGIMLGTPQYMAPEQAAGEGAVDARTDVYALGAVLYEMIAGEPPFAAESTQALLMSVIHEPMVALSIRRSDVPSFLDGAVWRALAKRPDDRFASAAAFAEALAVPLRGDTQSTSGASKRMVSARGAVYVAGAMVAIGLVGGWTLARSSLLERWASAASGAVSAPFDASVTSAPATTENSSLSVVDRRGRTQRTITASRPWTPRFSPNGRLVAYGAFGSGRSTSDLWVTTLDAGTTRRLTDDENDSNDPQWSADGATIAYSASAPGGKDLLMREIGGGEPTVLAARGGTQFASDWVRDGSALLVTEETGHNGRDILIQPVDGSKAWPYAATAADETAARISPDGRWVAYTSDESGRPEIYLDSYPRPRQRIAISSSGGIHPVWRRDGRELFYWNDGALVAVQLDAARGGAPPAVMRRTVLFRASYHIGPNTMYDVSPDGEQFVIVHSLWADP